MVVDATQLPATGAGGGGTGSGSGSSSTQETQSTGGGSAGQPASTQTQERPVSPASGAGTGAANGTGGTVETGTTEARPTADPDTEDPRALLSKNPALKRYVDSLAGDLAQRQARDIVAQNKAQEAAQARLEKRRQLRENDPVEFAKLDAEEENQYLTEQQVRAKVEVEQAQRFFAGHDNMLFEIQYSLPVEAQKEVEGKTFRDPTGDPWKSRQLYLDALVKAAIKHGVTSQLGPALTKAREDITDAARSEANGQARGGQPALNTQGGDAPGGAVVTQSEFDQYGRGHSETARAWRKENKDRIERSLSDGHITY